MHSSPKIVTPHRPDTSSAETLLSHPRFKKPDGAPLSGEDLAVAVWRYMIDKDCGFYHFWSPIEKPFGENVRRYVKDPLRLVNSYGSFLCGTAAGVETWLWRHAGFPARQVGLTGHVVAECSYDGEWHLLDADLQAFHRHHPPRQAVIASVADCLADTTLVSDQKNPSQPYYLNDRKPAAMAESCYAPGKSTCYPTYVPEVHSMDFFLRPGEEIVRFYGPKGRWFAPPEWVDNSQRYNSEWTAEGPRERFPPHRTYGNGFFRYRPDPAAGDLEAGALSLKGFKRTEEGLAVHAEAAEIILPVLSPYVIVGRSPDWKKTHESEAGAVLILKASGSGMLEVSLSVDDGASWREVVSTVLEEDERELKADFTPLVENRYRYLLRMTAKGAVLLRSLDLTTWFQVNPGTLPALRKGANEVSVSQPPDIRVPLTIDMTPELDKYLVRNSGRRLSEDARTIEGPFEAVFRLSSPWGGRIAGLCFFGSFHEVPEGAPHRQVAFSLASSPDGPWREFFRVDVPAQLHGQQDWPWGEGAFVQLDEPADEVFVKVDSPVDAWEFEARLEVRGLFDLTPQPLDASLTYAEDGRQARFTQRLEPDQRDCTFSIDCSAPPEMLECRLAVPSLRR